MAHPNGDVERPYVLTPDVQMSIIAALREGNFLNVACTHAGITTRCFDHWRKRCEDGDPDAQKFADFFLAVKKALAEAEVEALRVVRKSEPNWQGSAWYLERRYPRRWGRRVRMQLPPSIPYPTKRLEEMTDVEFEHYRAAVERRAICGG